MDEAVNESQAGTPEGEAVPKAANFLPSTEPQPVEPAPPQLNGIFVVSGDMPDGSISVDIQTVGSTRITEADTLLAMARKVLKERLGIN